MSVRSALRMYRGRQHAMQTMLRLGASVARRDARLRRVALRAGDRMVMACALGGAVPLFEREGPDSPVLPVTVLPVTVLVRGGPQVDRYVLYEAADAAETDRAAFQPLNLPAAPLYGGGIHVFRTDNRAQDRAYFVRAYAGTRRHDSDIMAAPIGSQPTRYVPGGLVVLGAEGPGRTGIGETAPAFDWGAIGGPHWVSFLVLRRGGMQRDSAQGLLAAVYVWGQEWRYPDLAATPFHYTATVGVGAAGDGAAGSGTGAAPATVSPATVSPVLPGTLPAGAEALYFAVQRDGWISAFARLPES